MYLFVLIAYVVILFVVSWFTSQRSSDNAAFFSANHAAPWYLVAFGMIGASVSGISVVSVPGMASVASWTYLQTCLGFFFGYVVVAYLLLPLYYRLHLTSIYQYLSSRFGNSSRLTGAWLFVIAKLVSSASKLYVAVIVLQQFVFSQLGVPLWLVIVLCVLIIWLYTMRSGIKTIVWTDSLQTAFLLFAVIILCIEVFTMLDGNFAEIFNTLVADPSTDVFLFADFSSPRNFWKQFFSGIFIVIVMTGLDQDMMQKNLSCRTLRQSQKNMLIYGAAFVPVNFLLLLLGSSVLLFASRNGVVLPQKSDDILPFVVSNYMSVLAGVAFMIGVVSATFSSADSALTAITTSLMVDIVVPNKNNIAYRRLTHIVVCVVFMLIVMAFGYLNESSVLDTIYTIVGYAYGPLLGLFAFGLFTKRVPLSAAVPVIAVLSPAVCYLINYFTSRLYNYHFGYELLMLNGLLTYIGLWTSSLVGVKGKVVQ